MALRKLVSGALLLAVVTTLLAVLGTSAAAVPAPAARDRGTLTTVCVDRDDRTVRVPSGGCGRGADRVRVSVAERLRLCVGPQRLRACDRRGAGTLLVPSNARTWFCAAPRGGALRVVAGPNRCLRGRALEARNHRPGAPVLSERTVPENVPVGTAVGALSATDDDQADRMTFRLVPGAGDDDNALFDVVGGSLVTAAPVDFEDRADYRVRVEVVDLLGLARAASFTVEVVDADENGDPTGLTLDPAAVAENQPAGTLVGRLTTIDPDADDRHVYTLVTAPGVPDDNPLFTVVGDELRTAAVLDHEAQRTRTVRVRADDGAGGSFERDITVEVTDGPDAPVGVSLAPSSLAENVAGPVGRLTAADPDASDAHTFQLVGGAGDRDNGSFTITGDVLSSAVPLDFETRSSYSVRVRVTDGAGLAHDEVLTVRVTDADDPPTGVDLLPSSVRENQPAGTTVGTLTVRDVDGGGSPTFTLVAGEGDDDNASFAIVGDELRTAAPLDYESGADLSVRVAVVDGSGLGAETVLSVSVVNVNESPSTLDITSSEVDENAPAGTVVGALSSDDPDLDDPIAFTLLDDAGGRFALDGDDLVTTGPLDHELTSSLTVRVRAQDAAGESAEAPFVITVADVNEAPSAPTINDDTVAENLPAGALVGTLAATDPDAGDSRTFTLVTGLGDDDNASFTIGAGGTLRTAAAFDHEAKATYSVRVRVTDGGTPALSTESVLTITVTDVNEDPSAPVLSSSTIAENNLPGALVGTLSATDPDSDPLTYTLAGGPDAADFQVIGGAVRALRAFDHEARSTYTIRVAVSDGRGGTSEGTVEITVTDANDAPTAVALSGDTVDENAPAGTVVGDLSATDQDAGDSHTFTLPAGLADNASFTVLGGQLRTAAVLDHEATPTLEVRVRVTDAAGASTTVALTVTVEDLDEAPTGISLSSSTVAENQPTAAVGTLSATDAEGGPMTFALVAGDGDTDNASFTILGDVLRATAPFDHEDRDTLSVRVRVTDAAGLVHVAVLEITVTDANEAPTAVAIDEDTVAENLPAGTVVGQLSATDEDAGDTFTYALVDGLGAFTVSAAGQVATSTPLDHEARSTYPVRVRVTDAGGLTHTATITITVADANDAPSALALSASQVPEDAAAGTTVGTLSTTDADAGDTHTYLLVAGAGDDDNALFSIVGSSLRVAGSLDHETAPTLSLRVRSTDGDGAFVEQELTVTVTDVDEAPTGLSLTSAEVQENLSSQVVGTLQGADPDSSSFVYELVAGVGDTDNASFAVNGSTLSATRAFDRETEPTLSVRVRVTADGKAFARPFTITVADGNDAPTGITIDEDSVEENRPAGTVVGRLSAVDEDVADTFTYELVDGVGAFTVSTDGVVETTRALDHETAAQLSPRFRVTDAGGATFTATVTIDVTDVNEAPTRVDLAPSEVDENEPSGAEVGTLTAIDPDDESVSPSFALVSGAGDADNAQFQVVGDRLVTRASFDREARATYSVRVRATDAAGLSGTTAITVTIGEVDEAPQITGAATFAVAENEPSTTTVGTLTAADPEGGSLTWSLVAGAGSADNATFAITSAGELRTAAVLDFETDAELQVRVRVSDGTHTAERVITVTVLDVNDAPVATDDTFTGAVGNTTARLGTAPLGGVAAYTTLTGALPLANDTDQDGDSIEAVAETITTERGGTAVVHDDGTFLYHPSAGVKAADDRFAYRVEDEEGARGTGRITVTIADRLVWYVGSLGDGATGLDGTSRKPYADLARLTGQGDVDGTGDDIFLYSDVTGALPLEASQRLLGGGLPGVTLTRVPTTPQLSAANGFAVSLANGSSVAGVRLVANGSNDAVRASSVTTSTIAPNAPIVQGGSGTAVAISGPAGGDITVGSTVSSTTGRAVTISGRTSGAVTFGQEVTATGSTLGGVSLSSNTGATITFNGLRSTGVGPAFSATGGGTVVVTRGPSGSQLSSSAGAALTVRNTTIGAAGLTFESVASAGGTHGILLDSTGTTGSLTVGSGTAGLCGGSVLHQGAPGSTPVPADCTGGTITGSTGNGISLVNTHAPSLTRVRVVGSGDDGIEARGLTGGMTIARSLIADNGDARDDNGVDLGGSHGVPFAGPAGRVSITDSAILRSADTNVFSGTSSGTTLLSMQRNRIEDAGRTAGARDGVRVEVTGGTGGLSLTDSYLSGNAGDHVQVISSDSGVVSEATIGWNRMTNGAGANQRGIVLGGGGSTWGGTLTYDVKSNFILGSTGTAVLVSTSNGTASVGAQGHVQGNMIGASGVPGSCSATGSGIRVSNEGGSGQLRARIVANTVRGCAADAVRIDTGVGGTASLVVTGNVLDQVAGGRRALSFLLGTDVSDEGRISCLDVSGNTLAGDPGLAVSHPYGVLDVVDPTATTPYTAAQAQANLQARNGNAAASVSGAQGQYRAVTSCPTPTNPS